MKKQLLVILLIAGAFSANASSSYFNDQSAKTEIGGRKYYYKRAKGNISPDQLPEKIIKYLDKHYEDYEIIVSKLKGNGNYFVKIRYNGGYRYNYYRSLVFDGNGNTIKG